MKSLAQSIEALGLDSAWLDGEIVVMSKAGVPDFNALQNAIDTAQQRRHRRTSSSTCRSTPAATCARCRCARAARVLKEIVERGPDDRIRLSQTFDAAPAQMLEAARRMSLEGIILKRPDAPYVSGRTETWLKLKVALRQEFVVCGFTDRSNAAREVGSLLLGTYENGELVYSGNVGTGWNANTGRDLHERLVALETSTPTLDVASVKPGRWSRARRAASAG